MDLKNGVMPSASKLTTPVRVNNASTDIAAPGDRVIEGVNSEAGFHSVGDGVSDDAPGGHVFTGKIVGYSIDSRTKACLAVDALEIAVTHRGHPTGVVVHSDRGSQFRLRKFVCALARHTLLGSMGKVGAAGDNAAMESFFALLQKNLLNQRSWNTRDELRLAIIHWIERTYHRRRRQRRLGKLTPVEFETIMEDAVILAA